MLGRFVRVKVTKPIFSTDEKGLTYGLNFGEIDFVSARKKEKLKAFVLGLKKETEYFDGVVAAAFDKGNESYYAVEPEGRRYIITEIKEQLAFFEPENIRCRYEHSCGAVVLRLINGEQRYLVIKNKRSAHWSFPKGHIESGESLEETARREVFEEAGIHIDIIPGFMSVSEYNIQNRVEKTVNIFLALTDDTNTVIQESEIEDYAWLPFEASIKRLRFENDRKILTDARAFIEEHGYAGVKERAWRLSAQLREDTR